jgi:hypothetical protein
MVAALAVAKRQLRIAVSPNHNCKDHEARILIDDEDLLGKDSCGLDPPDLAHQLASNDLRIRIGRCSCGTVGCDDIFADRRRKDGIVEWEAGGRAVEFDERDYDREVERFLCDRSWAPIERLAEFAADELLQGRTLNGLTFDWSSARIKAQAMTYSFSAAGEQRLVEFTWDGQTIESAIEATNQLLSEAYASESKHRLA